MVLKNNKESELCALEPGAWCAKERVQTVSWDNVESRKGTKKGLEKEPGVEIVRPL